MRNDTALPEKKVWNFFISLDWIGTLDLAWNMFESRAGSGQPTLARELN